MSPQLARERSDRRDRIGDPFQVLHGPRGETLPKKEERHGEGQCLASAPRGVTLNGPLAAVGTRRSSCALGNRNGARIPPGASAVESDRWVISTGQVDRGA